MKTRTTFKDAHKQDVKVGDQVRGYKVNTDLTGIVKELVTDPKSKPFAVTCVVNGIEVTCFFNSEYVEKVTG